MSLRRFVSIAALAAAVAGPDAAPAQSSAPVGAEVIRLEVDLSQRELRVLQGGEVVRRYDVAVGQPEHPTPTGHFGIGRVVWNPRWVPPEAEWARDEEPKEPGDPDNPMGQVKLFFSEPDYYIHGTTAVESLGRAASHGCLRMANADVVELARLVMEHGGEPRPPNWFRRVLNFVRSTREVRLSDPVPIDILP